MDAFKLRALCASRPQLYRAAHATHAAARELRYRVCVCVCVIIHLLSRHPSQPTSRRPQQVRRELSGKRYRAWQFYDPCLAHREVIFTF